MPKQIVRWKLFSLAALAMFASLIVSDSYVLASEPPSTGVAVIIGNKNYGGLIPNVDFAQNDANAFKRFVIDSLGYLPKNIIDLRDATKAQLESAFGNRETHEGKIWRYLDPRGTSEVIVFYSGHGVPGLKDKRGYLLPVDADPDTPEINGYPIDTLLSNLGKLNTKSVTVYLDACFSGNSPKGMLIRAASGISIVPKAPTGMSSKMTIITAAQGDQVASWDLKARHGLFTKYLLQALNGAANSTEYGVADYKVSLSEVNKFLDHKMTGAARRLFGRHQKVSVQGTEENVLAYPYKKRLLELESTDTKNAEQQYMLGRVYNYGESGFEKNFQKFILWTRRAAEQGDATAQLVLGMAYMTGGRGVSKDLNIAMKWLSKADAQGVSDAAFYLGQILSKQKGSEQEAFSMYFKAAEQGDAMAQYNVASRLQSGSGVSQNYIEAMKWYRKAAEQGVGEAESKIGFMFALGEGIRKDEKEAAKWFRSAADKGSVTAQFNIGIMTLFGRGIAREYREALKWFRKAAEQGHVEAQYNIGHIYYLGKGVSKDVRLALNWFRKAAEQGDVKAQHNLGIMYESGDGISKDTQEAARWFRKAAEQGHASAQYKLGNMYSKGEGVTQDYEKAARWYQKAADQGLSDAQFTLGIFFEQGIGVSQDHQEAKKWYRKAADQNNVLAKARLRMMKKK
jgi:TPR repeat protein